MNLNIINLDCSQWSKSDWVDAYNAYCRANMFGPKTKKEYYDMVVANHKHLNSIAQPLSNDLVSKWTNGFKNASVWAKKRKCNQWGQSLENSRPEINLEELQNDIKDIQWQLAQK